MNNKRVLVDVRGGCMMGRKLRRKGFIIKGFYYNYIYYAEESYMRTKENGMGE